MERKAREIVLAAEITRKYTKDEILELYLNENNYGKLSYGIEAAAETYFNTTADQLNLAQATFLAGLPQAPAVYDIFTNGKDDDGDGTTEDELGGTLDDSPGTPGVDDDGDGAIDDYDGAIFDDDDKVRLAVLENVRLVPASLRESYETLLNDKSHLNTELALENLCYSFPERYGHYLDVTSNKKGWRGINIRIKWLETAIEKGGEAYITELTNYTSSSYEFETRINAMNACRRLNLFDEIVCKNMIEGFFHWNFKIRDAARENLDYFIQQNDFQQIIHQMIFSGLFNDEQKKRLSGYFQ